MSIRIEPAQIRAETQQVRVYPVPGMGVAQFDFSSMMNVMMSMMQMILMIVFVLLPIQLMPKILGAIKI